MRLENCLCQDPIHPDRPRWYCIVSIEPDPYPSSSAMLSFTTPYGPLTAAVRCSPNGGIVTVPANRSTRYRKEGATWIDFWSNVEENSIRLMQFLAPVDAISVAEGLSRIADDLDSLGGIAGIALGQEVS